MTEQDPLSNLSPQNRQAGCDGRDVTTDVVNGSVSLVKRPNVARPSRPASDATVSSEAASRFPRLMGGTRRVSSLITGAA